MPNIAIWLLAMVVPLAKKLLLALGIGYMTYEGLSTIAGQARDAVISSYGGMPADVLAILALGGINQAIGIILSALTARAAIVAVGKIGRVAQG